MGIVSYLYSGTRLAENIRSVLVVLGIQKIYNILNMNAIHLKTGKVFINAINAVFCLPKRKKRQEVIPLYGKPLPLCIYFTAFKPLSSILSFPCHI